MANIENIMTGMMSIVEAFNLESDDHRSNLPVYDLASHKHQAIRIKLRAFVISGEDQRICYKPSPVDFFDSFLRILAAFFSFGVNRDFFLASLLVFCSLLMFFSG
jgi:hypothetical protein